MSSAGFPVVRSEEFPDDAPAKIQHAQVALSQLNGSGVVMAAGPMNTASVPARRLGHVQRGGSRH